MEERPYAIVILAAGASRRLGRAKQLLPYRDSTLLQQTVDAAASIACADTYTVLGCSAGEISQVLREDMPIISCLDWNMGMGSSISCAMKYLGGMDLRQQEYQAVIISVCDQPMLDSSVFDSLITTYERGNCSIVQCKYKIGGGPPTLFDRIHFSALAELSGEDGARSIVQSHMDQVSSILFPDGDIDIDTRADLPFLK